MNNLLYLFVLKTPSGYAIGEITVRIDNGNIEGNIRISDQNGSYRGYLDDNGTIKVSGTLALKEERISFVGEGRISCHAIHLTIPTEHFTYELDGTAR